MRWDGPKPNLEAQSWKPGIGDFASKLSENKLTISKNGHPPQDALHNFKLKVYFAEQRAYCYLSSVLECLGGPGLRRQMDHLLVCKIVFQNI